MLMPNLITCRVMTDQHTKPKHLGRHSAGLGFSSDWFVSLSIAKHGKANRQHTNILSSRLYSLLQECTWFETKNIEIAGGKMDKVPVGELCLKCGICCSTFPEMTPTEVVAKARTDRKFRGKLLIMGEIHDNKRDRDFNCGCVQTRHAVGLQIALDVALVSSDAFKERLHMPPGSLGSAAL